MRPLAAAVAAIAALLVPAATQAAYPGSNGPLVFQSSRDGDNEIYLLNPDGTGTTKLTDNTAADLNPAWSPDGQRIAFQSNRDGDSEIWVMDADGSGQTALTDDSAFDGEPTWSPDGTRIAFTSDRDGDREVFKMNADGSDEVQLTANAATDDEPAWGSDQACTPTCTAIGLIAFTTDRDGNDEIYLMGEDGGGVSNFTQRSSNDRSPSWRLTPVLSIAFATDRGSSPGDPDFDVWDQSMGGIGGTVADGPTDEVAPAWSPDGQRIAYERDDDGNREVYVTLPAGNVTTAPTNERAPDWRPEASEPSTYVRPRGATPLRVPLAPAFTPCTAPNRTHGPPLAFPSCSPPTALSPNITIGTPDSLDSDGGAANAVMSARLDVRPGIPGPPHDSDVGIVASFSDIRCRADLPTCGPANGAGTRDYTGEIVLELAFQVTDRWNASVPVGGADTATGDLDLAIAVGCQGTANTSIGGACAVSTSVSAIAGAALPDAKRSVWQLDQVRVTDGGPDGAAGTADNSVFAKQAVFVP